MSEASDPNPGRVLRVMKWLLGAQLGLAALLILFDLGPSLPRLLAPSSAPALDRPIGPNDQTRFYRLNRPANPGPGIDPDMPRRLLVETTDLDGVAAMRLRGAIAPGDGDRVAEELRTNAPALVLLDSPGGSVMDALALGRVIRDLGADTRLEGSAVCMSACPYMFAAGTDRKVDEAARLGVHQHSFGESSILPAFLAVEDIQRGQAEVLSYLDDMGVDLRIMGPAMATPAVEIYILSEDELRDWNVVTGEE